MSKEVRDTWSSSNCDELIKFNRVLTCNQRYGWRFFNYWLLQRYKAPPQESDGIECVVSSKENQFCRLTNVTLNFAKVKIDSSTRVFSPGFIETHGTKSTDSEPGPGHLHINTPSLSVSDVEKVGTCDHWETRPTFFLSNDDPFNLSHYYNEVIMIWSMLLLAGVSGYDIFDSLASPLRISWCRAGLTAGQYGRHQIGGAIRRGES
jgi:hypothetical protein